MINISELALRVLRLVDQGLTFGLGQPEPGKMSLGATVCYSLCEHHSHYSMCVSPLLSEFGRCLNDASWSNDQARGRGLRRFAIAQLGSSRLDEEVFVQKLLDSTFKRLFPVLLKQVSTEANITGLSKKLLEAANRFEQEGSSFDFTQWTMEAKLLKEVQGGQVLRLIFAFRVGHYANIDIVRQVACVASAGLAPQKGGGGRDRMLEWFVEDVVLILEEMRTPGSRMLCFALR